ncbi:MAG TPA: ATP synthase F0 subunit B [Terriglobia bacterium]|nr:ATP synthase F0 subunit B [Terriglobia bacterium]
MSVIFNQLGQLFLHAIPTIILVFLLFVILDRTLFRPLLAVMKQRDDASVGALARAREQARSAETKTRQYEEAFQAARQEVYRLREEDRQKNLAERDAALRKARQQAEGVIRDARVDLAAQVAQAQTELDAACRPLAEEITQSLVGAGSIPGGQERSRN